MIVPRQYQTEASNACTKAWESGTRSVLVELPTGSGKTVLAAMKAKEQVDVGRRVLFVAPRRSLVEQSARELAKLTGHQTGVFMGGVRENLHSPIIVGCTASLTAQNLRHFRADEFGLLVQDEAHHSSKSNQSYMRSNDWATQGQALVMGITATPDRTDKSILVGLGKPFEELAYRYPIWSFDGQNAIDHGWLVPVVQEHVKVQGLDFSAIRDKKIWTDQDIESIVGQEGPMLEMASAAAQVAGIRPTVIFGPTVAFANKMKILLERYVGEGNAVCIHADHADYPLADDERARREHKFRSGAAQFMVNVDVCTEGWDCSTVACIVIMRPMKSRLRFAQCVGRGTRIHLPHLSPSQLVAMEEAERREAIAASTKPDCLVVGFYSSIKDLKLWCNVEDILGEQIDQEVVERSRQLKSGSTTNRIKKAISQIEAEREFFAEMQDIEAELRRKNYRLFQPRAEVRRERVTNYSSGGQRLDQPLQPIQRSIPNHEQRQADRQQSKILSSISSAKWPTVKQCKFAVALGVDPHLCLKLDRRQLMGVIGKKKDQRIEPNFKLLNSIPSNLAWFFMESGRQKAVPT